MDPILFATPVDLRTWFADHHAARPELLLGIYKKASGWRSMRWPKAVEEALCVGWMDGVRRRLDAASYMVRFTPHRRGSIWSRVKVERVAQLSAEGRMLPEGPNREPDAMSSTRARRLQRARTLLLARNSRR